MVIEDPLDANPSTEGAVGRDMKGDFAR